MTKKLKLSFILTLVFFAIITCWNTLSSFFSGAGLNFVALISILAVLLYAFLSDSFVRSRIKELFIVVCVFVVLELLVYVVYEFGVSNIKVLNGFAKFQNVLTAFGLVFLIYTFVRFFTDLKGIKLNFVEIMLGNVKCEKKHKEKKELSNGSLEEKPINKAEENYYYEEDEEESIDDDLNDEEAEENDELADKSSEYNENAYDFNYWQSQIQKPTNQTGESVDSDNSEEE